MSTRTAVLLCTTVMVACPAAVLGQSAGTVVERYTKAIGGKAAVSKIVSTEVAGTVKTSNGRSGTFLQTARRPQLFTLRMTWGTSRVSIGFNGRAAWQDDGNGARTLYGEPASRVRSESAYANRMLALADTADELSIVNREDVRDHQTIVVLAVAPDGRTRRLFFDATSYLLVKDEQQTADGKEERYFDDYRGVDGVLEPHRIEWHRGTETFLVTIERVTHNAAIDKARFDVPDASAAAGIDPAVLVAAAGRNERRAVNLAASYTYNEVETFGRLDSKGRLTETERHAYEIVHIRDRVVRRLVRTRGSTLSEADRRREDERVNGLLRLYQSEPAVADTARGGAPANPPSSLILAGPLGKSMLDIYPRLWDFITVRREQLGGRATIVIEVQPKRNAKASTDAERQAAATAGTLWIDEAAEYAVRIELFFLDNVNGNARGSSVRTERTLVNGDTWLPSRQEMHLRRTMGIGKSVNWLDSTQDSNHRKFTVESDLTFTLPTATP